jgi:hypothetical protein
MFFGEHFKKLKEENSEKEKKGGFESRTGNSSVRTRCAPPQTL